MPRLSRKERGRRPKLSRWEAISLAIGLGLGIGLFAFLFVYGLRLETRPGEVQSSDKQGNVSTTNSAEAGYWTAHE